jgi:ribosome biogenesis GTPase
MIIVGSAAQPDLKPGLIDRLIVAAESAGIRPLICLNKVDLVDPSALVPLAGVFARMGYPVVLCSTVTGMGVARLQAELRGRVTAVVGQSGVGKSSLLNALDPGLDLRVAEVSRDNEKGRHTTTTARPLREVGRMSVTSITASMVSPTTTGARIFWCSSSMARPVPWIMVCKMKPSISV